MFAEARGEKQVAVAIRNRNRRDAYYRAACSVFAAELVDIEPMHVCLFIYRDAVGDGSEADCQEHLAAIRTLPTGSSSAKCLPPIRRISAAEAWRTTRLRCRR
jgi:hypothetical protein